MIPSIVWLEDAPFAPTAFELDDSQYALEALACLDRRAAILAGEIPDPSHSQQSA